MHRLLPALIALLVLSGCASGQDDASIRAVMAKYTDAWSKRDTATLCSLMTPDTNAAFARKGKSCPEYMGTVLAGKSAEALANARKVRINRVFVKGDDHALVVFTGGNGDNTLKKVGGRWLIDGVAPTTG